MRLWAAIVLLALITAGGALTFWPTPPETVGRTAVKEPETAGMIGGEVVDFFENHGNWETLCDNLPGDPTSKRCYIRLVDVYSQRPAFGAYIGFVTLADDGRPVFELAFEKDCLPSGDVFAVVREDETVWRISPKDCEGNLCRLDADAFAAMREAAKNATDFRVTFTDGAGRLWRRELSGEGFRRAYMTFETVAGDHGASRG